MLGNLDGVPGFTAALPPRKLGASGLAVDDFTLSSTRPSAALHAGNPDASFNDLDGTSNTLGFTGGPGAPRLP